MPPNADKLLFMLAPIMAHGHGLHARGDHPVRRHHLPARVPRRAGRTSLDPARAVERWGTCAADARSGYFPIDLMVAPLGVGILFVFAMAGQGIIGAAIAGWSSDNKFSLMGALRAASQMVSYEVTLGMSLIGAMMIYGTVRLDDMVRWQDRTRVGHLRAAARVLPVLRGRTSPRTSASRSTCRRPRASSCRGTSPSTRGMKFGMFYFAEYAEVVTGSMLLVTIFLGGWALPFFHRDGLTDRSSATRRSLQPAHRRTSG